LALSFVKQHGLWSDEQKQAAVGLPRRAEDHKLNTIRFSFPDQHGILRGKALVATEALSSIESGCSITTTLLAKDTSHRTVFPVFSEGGGFGMSEMQGGGDVLMLADPTTFKVLPWAPGTGWVMCDLYFADGRPVPFASRGVYRAVLERLAQRGFDFKAGLEVECHIFKVENSRLAPTDAGSPGWPGEPPEISLLSQGYQYLTEQRYDQMEPVLDLIRRDLVALGLPLRSIEVEYGPSQCEFVFQPTVGLEPADTMVLFRAAVKQICNRNGYHATFMCRPRIPNVMSSGWHLHQSLVDRKEGTNAFMTSDPDGLSKLGKHYMAGLLEHARASAVFSTPTINGYKRYRSYSLAPDRAIWGRDNRGVMIRVLGGPGDRATRLENRIGEPAANPYLYMASQILAGLNGIDRSLDPGASADTAPYETKASFLPTSLREAVFALKDDPFFSEALGQKFVDYYAFIKNAEIERFQSEVTEWEQREYFEMF
jgi:glutamine synthetase